MKNENVTGLPLDAADHEEPRLLTSTEREAMGLQRPGDVQQGPRVTWDALAVMAAAELRAGAEESFDG